VEAMHLGNPILSCPVIWQIFRGDCGRPFWNEYSCAGEEKYGRRRWGLVIVFKPSMCGMVVVAVTPMYAAAAAVLLLLPLMFP